jgi:hypothetical protein
VARIRNVKPEFFRHEALQALGPVTMLVFQGLWCQADKAGNFQWRPSQLKLDILPFIEYDLGSSMEALWKTGFVIPYTGADGKDYGHIPNFSEHQRFSGTELKASPKYPAFSNDFNGMEVPKNLQGSSEEATRKHDGSRELGVRTMDNGVMDKGKIPRARFAPPTVTEVQEYCRQRKNQIDPQAFVDFYASKGWVVGKSPMKDWQAAMRTWEKNTFGDSFKKKQSTPTVDWAP